ncbi:Uncharacterised protein [Mycobacteroides abscessus subsp. abscessus]|nr:Uncharacterised protein [Mycobacteroides abscessus subsp. abscessus]SKU54792.1 Uncharacterised protein [Mycobacteroides abscessus subsp. abscessus]
MPGLLSWISEENVAELASKRLAVSGDTRRPMRRMVTVRPTAESSWVATLVTLSTRS